MPVYGSFAQQSRPALHLRGAYTSARTPHHQPNPFESQARTWMRGGPAETPLYGRSWPPTTKPLGRMIGHAQRPRYVVIVFLCSCTHCLTPSHATLIYAATFTTPLPHSPYSRPYDSSLHHLPIVLARIPSHYCNTSQSPTRPGVTLKHFPFAHFLFRTSTLQQIAQPRHRLAIPENTR